MAFQRHRLMNLPLIDNECISSHTGYEKISNIACIIKTNPFPEKSLYLHTRINLITPIWTNHPFSVLLILPNHTRNLLKVQKLFATSYHHPAAKKTSRIVSRIARSAARAGTNRVEQYRGTHTHKGPSRRERERSSARAFIYFMNISSPSPGNK